MRDQLDGMIWAVALESEKAFGSESANVFDTIGTGMDRYQVMA